jgi:hypothetical protein
MRFSGNTLMQSVRLVAIVAVLTAVAASRGAAQSQRPYRGLFGGGQPISSRSQTLDLTLSGFGGWDSPDDLPPQPQPTDTSDRAELDGPFGGTAATLVYTRPGKRLNMSGYGTGFVGHFPESESSWYTSSAAGFLVNASFDLGSRTTLRLGEQASWATDYRVGFLNGGTPGSDIPPASGNTGFDNAIERSPSITTQSTVDLTHQFSRKASLTTFYNFRYVYFFPTDAETRRPDGQDHAVGVRYDYRVTPYATLHAGYAYRRYASRGVELEPVVFHDIDLGVNFGKAISLTRTTKFSFNTGSTVAATAEQDSVDGSTFSDPRFFIVGGASLTQQLGRSWTAHADYNRYVNYIDGFAEASLQDQASAGVGGLIGRRTDVSAGVHWTTAAFGLDERNFNSWLASSQIRTAITRNMAFFASYYFYFYDFGQDVQLPQGLVRNLDRQGVRVGLTTWFPLWSSRGAP